MSHRPSTGGHTARRAWEITTVGIGAIAACSGTLAQTLPGTENQIETVNVTARRSHLDKLPDEIKNTPQSIDIIPQDIMERQGTASIQDALRNVPGITLNAGEGGSHGDSVNLRGFSASDDFFLDGQRDTGTYFRDTFDLAAIEVYEGPASTLFGRGSTGGVINQVSKTPTLTPIDELRLTANDAPGYRATADVDMPLSDVAALRVNLMGEDSRVVDRDYVRNRRWGIAPSVAYGMDTDTTLTLSILNQEEDSIPDYGIPFVLGQPAPVSRKTYYGLVDDDRSRGSTNIVTAKLTHDFGGGLLLTETARYGNYWFDYRMTAPNFGAPCSPPTLPLSADLICRDRPSSSGTINTLMNQTDLTYRFQTGSFSHTLISGVEVDRESDDLVRYANQIATIPATPLLDPDPLEIIPNLHQTMQSSLPQTVADTISGYLIDTMDITTQWSLEAAVRFDHFDANYKQTIAPVTQFHHIDDVASPRAALVYKPDANQTYYFSYGTSYNPSAEDLTLSSKDADLGPEKDRTFELGAKMQFMDGKLGATAAIFDTTMDNARISDPDDPTLQALSGNLKVQGIQLGVTGYLTEHWEIEAGYIHLSPKAEGLAGTGLYGPIANTAHNQANLWTTYEFGEGVEIGTGINYLGQRWADPEGQEKVPSYITWDAMAAYRIDEHLELQFNATNLTDAYYFASSYYSSPVENHVLPGPGRTLSLTAILDL